MSDYDARSYDRDSKAVTLVYILYFIGFATGISALAGVVIAHAKAGQVEADLQSHFEYQIKTFWYGLAMIVLGTLLSLILIGWILLLWWVIWTAIRCIKGIMAANEGRPIENPDTWMW